MRTIQITADIYDLASARDAVYRRTLLATARASIERPGGGLAGDDNLISLEADPGPRVGQPCTIAYYSDRVAATVVAVSKGGSKVTVREDKSHRIDDNGMSELQSYWHDRDPEGQTHVFFRRKGGYRTDGIRLWLGTRSAYHDYGF